MNNKLIFGIIGITLIISAVLIFMTVQNYRDTKNIVADNSDNEIYETYYVPPLEDVEGRTKLIEASKQWRENRDKAYKNMMAISKKLHDSDFDFAGYINSLNESDLQSYILELKQQMKAYQNALNEYIRISSEDPFKKKIQN